MKKFLIILLLVTFCSADQAEVENDIKIENESTTTIGVTMNDKVYDNQPDMNLNSDSTYSAVIKTNLGDMAVEFYTDDAPLTVNNFVTCQKTVITMM